jgi:hypothetical protein
MNDKYEIVTFISHHRYEAVQNCTLLAIGFDKFSTALEDFPDAGI